LLGKYLETNNEITDVAIQQRRKQAYTATQLMSEQLKLLGYNSGNGNVLHVVNAEELS
jgi:hypothetical protein